MSFTTKSSSSTTTTTTTISPDSTVLLGGGIIGLSTAYYLSLSQFASTPRPEIHILDPSPALLLSASGYAGGFLAKDWFSPGVAALGALSFRLHRELAAQHEGGSKWGYSACTAYSLSVDGVGAARRVRKRDGGGERWLDQGTSRASVAGEGDRGDGSRVVGDGEGAERGEELNDDGSPAWITRQEGGFLEVISGEDGCAQVEPRELCEWLVKEVEKRGVKIHLGATVTGVSKDDDGKITGLKVKTPGNDIIMACKKIAITSGAWTSRVFKTLFPNSKTKIGIRPLAGYSIVVRSPRHSKPILDPAKHSNESNTAMCHSVFCAPGTDWSYAPEVFSRMTKSGRPEIYIAGLNDPNMPLPPDVTAVKEMMDLEKMEDLKHTTVLLTGRSREGDDLIDDDLEVIRHGLCLRPVSDSGRPIVTKLNQHQLGQDAELVHDDGGVFVAAGHGPWGISLSLGTGLVMSELLQGKPTSADIGQLGVR